MAKTVTYAPHQLRTVRRFLRAGGADAKDRASKMSGLSLADIDVLCEIDSVCKALVGGKPEPQEKPQATVRPIPKPPPGPEVMP